MLGGGRSYKGLETYRDLYNKASKDDQKTVPHPDDIRADDNTVALAALPGGLENVIGNAHAHPETYAGRATDGLFIPIPGLTITPYEKPIVRLLEVAGKYGLVAIMPIPQHCGSPGGITRRPIPLSSA